MQRIHGAAPRRIVHQVRRVVYPGLPLKELHYDTMPCELLEWIPRAGSNVLYRDFVALWQTRYRQTAEGLIATRHIVRENAPVNDFAISLALPSIPACLKVCCNIRITQINHNASPPLPEIGG